MEQYSAISKLFLETIEETLSEEFNRNRIPQPQSNKGKINLRPKGLNTSDLEEVYRFLESLDTTELDPDYMWCEQLRYLLPQAEPFRKYFFSSNDSFPTSPQSQCQNDNEDDMLYDDYPISRLVGALQCDLFAYIASLLLFRHPMNYKKSEIHMYYNFESTDEVNNSHESNMQNRIRISDKMWDNFRKKREFLTSRIKAIPMPPHFLFVYSDSKIKEIREGSKIDPAYKFLVEDDIYNDLSLEKYLELESEVIFKNIEWSRNETFSNDRKPSPLLDFLTMTYIERVFEFNMVYFSIGMLSETNRDIKSDNFYSGFFTMISLSKSNALFCSKIPLLCKLIFKGLHQHDLFSKPDIFRVVYSSFHHIAQKAYNKFIEKYTKKYKKDPRDALKNRMDFKLLYDNLSVVFTELFESHLSATTDVSNNNTPNSILKNLSPKEKKLIMEQIVNTKHQTPCEAINYLDSLEKSIFS